MEVVLKFRFYTRDIGVKMHTYVKLKDGRIMILYGENSKRGVYFCYSLDENPHPNDYPQTMKTIKYDDVAFMDTNLFYIQSVSNRGL
jgi:hypothetical protein